MEFRYGSGARPYRAGAVDSPSTPRSPSCSAMIAVHDHSVSLWSCAAITALLFLASRRAALPRAFTDLPRATVWVHARPHLAIGVATRTASRVDGGEPLVCSWRARVPVAATRRLVDVPGIARPRSFAAPINSCTAGGKVAGGGFLFRRLFLHRGEPGAAGALLSRDELANLTNDP